MLDKLKQLVIPVIASTLLLSAPALADNGSSDVARLASTLKTYQTYQASFIQIVVNENGSQVQESRGHLKARRPGLFYWETETPHAQFIVSDGDSVSVYDPDLEQVTVHGLDDQVATTPALLLSGEVGNLEETYQVSLRSLGDSTREFTLEPKNPDSLFVSLRLTFYGNELQEMRMEDSLGQLSILSFNDIRLNEEIPRSAFSLDYPEGVDIIRDGA